MNRSQGSPHTGVEPTPARPFTPPGLFAATWTILRKDLRLELRSRESLTAIVLFSVTTFVTFHFGLNRNQLNGDIAAGVLWVTLLFAAVLAINRLLVAEQEQGGFDLMRAAPIDRNAVLLAKVAGLFLTLSVLEVVVVACFSLLLLQPGIWSAVTDLIAIFALANLGIATVGTLVASLTIQTDARELLVPLLGLPLALPILIGGARATAPLFAIPAGTADFGRWLTLMGLYDMVFLLISYAIYDFLLDD